MWRRIEDYTEEHRMIEEGDRILLGLSGGADSILLARYLITLQRRQKIFLVAVHVNHQLRGDEAVRDEVFVREFCDRWKIPCHIYREDVGEFADKNKCSVEEAGRVIRYRCYSDCAEKSECHKIALAHHGDDLAETMIFRMIRGTGPEGLPGILPINGRVIRPLLCLDKKEIRRMLAELSQEFVEDSSNEQTDYSRNYIRRFIMPRMQELNPQATGHMISLAGQMQEYNEFIRNYFDRIYHEKRILSDTGVRVSFVFLKSCDSFSQKEIIRRMLFDTGGKRKDLSFVHVALVQELLEKSPGKRLDLPYGVMAVREREYLYLGRCVTDQGIGRPESSYLEETDHAYIVDKEKLESGHSVIIRSGKNEEYQFELMAPDQCEIRKNDCVKYFNYDKIENELFLRTRKHGDYFVIDHLGRKKLLRRYFIDEKIAVTKRNEIFLLAEGNHILWITGGRISEAYKVLDQTRQVLRVTYRKKTEVTRNMSEKISVLISEETVNRKIKELGEKISKDYAGKQVHLICILKGGAFFACELAKRISIPVSIDFMQVSSYENSTTSSGIVRIKKDLDESLEDKEVLIVEDIIDTGNTLHYLIPVLMARKPKSLKLCALLNKPDRRQKEVEISYLGFDIPDKFVIGYGLDYAQKYRNLPYIGVVETDQDESE